MNIIQWYQENLDYRCLMHQCYLNINGKTESVKVSLHKGVVTLNREANPILVVDLRDLDPVARSLYYFEQDNGIGAMIVIPDIPDDYEDK